jgi:6-phosphogluconolactonase (cycloisomerase 2 family)
LAVGAVALGASAATAGAASLYASQNELGANSVAEFHIGAGGQLEPLSPASVGADQRPLGIATSPDGKSAYAYNNSSGKISQYNIEPNGALNAKNPFLYTLEKEVNGRGALAVSPNSANVYASGYVEPGGELVYQLAASGAGLLSALTPGYVLAEGITQIAVHPTLPKVYVARGVENKVGAFDMAVDGKLSGLASSTATNPISLAVTPDGKYLYAPAHNFPDVRAYKIDQTTGALSEIAGSPFAVPSGNPENVVATNSSVYVTANGLGVAMFDIEASTGKLTLKTPASVVAGSNPDGIVVSPDGTSAYVAISKAIAQYDIGAGGVLSAKSPATVAVTGLPRRLAVSTTGTGADETPVGPVPTPPAATPPKPTPPPEEFFKYVAYQYKPGTVLVMKAFYKNGEIYRVELEVAKCEPPPETPTKCAGLVEVTLRKDGTLPVVARASKGGKKQQTVIAKGKFSIPKGKSGKVTLKLTAAGRKAVKGKRSLNGWLTTKLGNGAETLAGQQKVKLKIPPPP